MGRFKVVASGDFLREDGSPAFPDFDFGPLRADPRIDFRFLDRVATIRPEQVAEADALLLSDARVTAESFDGGGRLALVAQCGAGVDHIDVAEATRNGIAVTNTPDGVRRPVAVAILTLMLTLTGKLLTKTRLVAGGAAGWAEVTRHKGVGLTGKILGSIGIGNIGAELFRLTAPFGMRFLAHDPYAPAGAVAALGVETVALDELFRRADILCINCPLTPETRRLVDARRIALMKPTAYLINTARGGVVDQSALTAALTARRIAGAALDVFDPEPPDPDDPLLHLDNVVLTPHALCWTDELFAGCGRDAVSAILDVVEGRSPAHLVDRAVAGHEGWRGKLERFGAMARQASTVTETL